MGGRLVLWYHIYGSLWTAKNIQTNNLISVMVSYLRFLTVQIIYRQIILFQLWYHIYGSLWTAKNIQTNSLISENILFDSRTYFDGMSGVRLRAGQYPSHHYSVGGGLAEPPRHDTQHCLTQTTPPIPNTHNLGEQIIYYNKDRALKRGFFNISSEEYFLFCSSFQNINMFHLHLLKMKHINVLKAWAK